MRATLNGSRTTEQRRELVIEGSTGTLLWEQSSDRVAIRQGDYLERFSGTRADLVDARLHDTLRIIREPALDNKLLFSRVVGILEDASVEAAYAA